MSQVLDSEPKQPIPIPQPQPEPALELPPKTFPSSEEGLDLPESIIVRKFEFDGNTAFSDEKLTKITAQFTKRSLTFVELLQVEATITKLYTDAGYINCGAVIPAGQTLSQHESVVKIQIIEGGLEEIAVTGTRRLNSNYIRSRLAIATARPLNQKRLLSALQLLQLDPLIQNISAELSAGSRPELSLLTVKVIEADSFNTEFFIDNSRAPSVGSLRRGVRINEGNLFGFGDGLNLEYINTDGSNAFDLRYNIPVNPRNGTITLRGGLTSTEIVEPPFDRLDIIGNSNYFELGFRQPLILSPNREFAVGLSALRQESKSEVLGFPLVSVGANERGETRIFALQFFQEYQQRNSQQALALRSQFNLGLDIFNATVNNEPPDSRFFSWRGQGQYVRLLAPQTLLVIRSDLQFSTRALLPLEQFGLGGLRSVRGYRQDILLTDNGFLGSAEVQLPILRVENVKGVLQVVPFIDFGVGWNSSGNTTNPNPNTLLGFGLGLQWQMGDRFNARLDYGIPLTDIQDRGSSLQEDGIYFSIVANPF
ncbi:ShlB/FhaC/HecB family hemolysin secretion/activation protein [Nostoc sp. UHCC 0251]|nr:ShlB/FhaC/HecB family hemolysin secretion/activation protein [Nostoc sp. UHCC 0251]MEA5621826.1 ShlB/FhaC/HecB family hemolysin secretion/activation protein [Nostoc sp. UHCC 0251]